MPLYSKESLDLLRGRVDLLEVVSAHIPMQKSGTSYKACCPFHEEKSPSFMMQRGDKHYHCFGCGAHGDAIAFLMGYVKMSFVDALEYLAERFQVRLERLEQEQEDKGPSKTQLKSALDKASRYYHFFLLHTEEGQVALRYLYERGIDLSFIQRFQVGYALKQDGSLTQLLRSEGVPEEVLLETGLLSITSTGRKRDFFQERITFPIRDPMGAVIGFSARKFKEETFGGKYINTQETPLFKKSQVLFGLSYCRQTIAKERKALIVEGQIDALRLIHTGFTFTVAGQGTAFGEGHVRELVSLGVNHVYLALDADKAGMEAAVKIGDLFQHKGIDVSVLELIEGSDPDSFIKERGPEGFSKLMTDAKQYLHFVYGYLLGKGPVSPSKKSEIVELIVERIKKWDHPVLVHESLKKLAIIAGVPEATIGMGAHVAGGFIRRGESVTKFSIDPNKILETDLIRWILLSDAPKKWIELSKKNITAEQMKTPACKSLYAALILAHDQNSPIDLLSLGSEASSTEEQQILADLMQRKINIEKAEEGIKESIRKIQLRHWMEEREAIKIQIQQSNSSEEEVLLLAKKFDELRRNPPVVVEL
ncbi:MAG: DNA primase [Chlamydiae bacterium]|nr:DNA primase [Chlamydiota bacterium]